MFKDSWWPFKPHLPELDQLPKQVRDLLGPALDRSLERVYWQGMLVGVLLTLAVCLGVGLVVAVRARRTP